MKKIVTLIIIVMITSTLLAEIEFKKGFGISAGMTSAYGVSYRYVNKVYGFQTTYGGGTGKSNAIHSIGLQLIKPIHSIPKTRFNIIAGFGTFASYEDNHLDDMSYSIGIGPEIEITFSGNMRFIIGSPFTVIFHYDDDSKLASFMPAMSLIYYLK